MTHSVPIRLSSDLDRAFAAAQVLQFEVVVPAPKRDLTAGTERETLCAEQQLPSGRDVFGEGFDPFAEVSICDVLEHRGSGLEQELFAGCLAESGSLVGVCTRLRASRLSRLALGARSSETLREPAVAYP